MAWSRPSRQRQAGAGSVDMAADIAEGMMQTRDAREVVRLRGLLDEERRKRLAAEQKAAGLRSAVVRMQALLAKQKADEALTRAEHAAS